MTVYVNISNTFNTQANTGIQRVVREVISRLVQKKDIVLIVWFKTAFYQLECQEITVLLAGDSFEPANKINITTLNKGNIFFDIDASWADPYDIKQLYQLLKGQGLILVKMHYDAVPILFPQFSHPNTVFSFTDNFSAALQYCDYWLCISQAVHSDFLKIAKSVAAGQPIAKVIPLGADFNPDGSNAKASLPAKLEPFKHIPKYILLVGTVEPRKNHQLILDVFDQLQDEDHSISLVIAGKRGWHITDITERIETHPLYGKQLFWLQNATDAEIVELYKNAFVSVNLSHYEGYGLPVIESLSYGCVTLCARNSVMEEVTLGAAYCVTADRESVVNAIKQLGSEEIYTEYKHKAKQFLMPKWEGSAREISFFLDSIQHAEGILSPPRQAVYISIRADGLYRSLQSVIKNMRFINKVVILCSDKAFSAISEKLANLSIDISLIKESELGIIELPDDHQIRNTYLRRKLYAHPQIEANFIAFDDDSIAIDTVNIGDFLEQGKHKAHYYYQDGRDWLGAYPVPTSFDHGLWRTVRFLHNGGYDSRLYNSHMPQIINKNIGNMILERTAGLDLDEWSCYFNIAKYIYPQYFQDQSYRVIAWPPDLKSWLPSVRPEKILFQNYYAKDTDLSVQPANKIAGKINKWLTELTKKQSIQASITPGQPEIMISEAGLSFNASQINCHKDANIYIKLSVATSQFQIKCRFDMYETIYSDESLPRYLLIPAHLLNEKAKNNVTISLKLVKNGDFFESSIPIIIL